MPALHLTLQHLRQARGLVRLVLLWFALSLGAAMASPWVSPQGMQLVCSASGGMKLLQTQADGAVTEVSGSSAMDCPLCSSLAPPQPPTADLPEPAQPLGHMAQAIPAARLATLTRAPLPARGPPPLN
ncbi:MAG: hypothetical protein RLZZ126_1879 [Pseudomonadota bacterium]|jgi:hypothetical protein